MHMLGEWSHYMQNIWSDGGKSQDIWSAGRERTLTNINKESDNDKVVVLIITQNTVETVLSNNQKKAEGDGTILSD
jgi:hypothetical protein